MSDNFDSHKWFKKQYLEEANINESEEEFQEYIERFEAIANIRDLKTLRDMLRIVSADWMQDGFDKEDIKKYINHYIDQI
jgi:hypothetical protein